MGDEQERRKRNNGMEEPRSRLTSPTLVGDSAV